MLLTELQSSLKKEEDEYTSALASLKSILKPQQEAAFLGWLFGVRGGTDFHPIWATKLANLRRAPFGRHLPCFQSLSAIQLDVLGSHLPKKVAAFRAGQEALAGPDPCLRAAGRAR